MESSGKNVCMLERMGSSSKNRDGSQLVSSVADEYMEVIKTDECFTHKLDT